jgi:hypothetical protein
VYILYLEVYQKGKGVPIRTTTTYYKVDLLRIFRTNQTFMQVEC